VNDPEQQMANAIAASTEYAFMEGDVGLETFLIRATPLHRHNGMTQSGQIFRGCSFRSTSRKLWLHNQSGFKQFVMGKVVKQNKKVQRFLKD
jgi:hypothetical protein